MYDSTSIACAKAFAVVSDEAEDLDTISGAAKRKMGLDYLGGWMLVLEFIHIYLSMARTIRTMSGLLTRSDTLRVYSALATSSSGLRIRHY
jgi:hypothetical protein